jgi:hypothetical protein
MNEEKIRIKKLKANYKELKQLYKQTYESPENRSKDSLQKRYIDEHIKINKAITLFIRGINKIPKYNENQDKKNLEKWKLVSSIGELKQLDSWAYGNLQFSSDKELKRTKKELKKKLDSSGKNHDEAVNLAQKYMFIRRKLHYRNEMNKAVGIDLQEFYISYAPWDSRVFNQVKAIYENHQWNFEQLNEIQEGEYVLIDAHWEFKEGVRQNAGDRNSQSSLATYYNVKQKENYKSVELHPLYHLHTYEVIDRPNSYVSVRSNDSGYETPIQSTERTFANGVERVSDVKRKEPIYNKLYEDKDQLALRLGYDILEGKSVSSESINHADKKTIKIVMNRAEEEAKKQRSSGESTHYLTVRNGKESLA